MPLDPSIILQGQNPNAAFQQAQAQQLQKYQVAQAKQDFEDQQNLKQAWRQAGGDPTKTLQIASQLGVSPKMVQAFQSQQVALQQHYADLHKTQADTDKTNLDVQDTKHKAFADMMDPAAKAADPTQFAALKSSALAQAVNLGKITQDEANQYANVTQQQWQDQQTMYRSALINSEIVKNTAQGKKADTDATVATNKDARDAAESILVQKQQKLGQASTALNQAYSNGGPVAYKKVLDGLLASDPATAANFPVADNLAKLAVPDATKAINYGGMTSEQRQKADQEQRNEKQLETYQSGMLNNSAAELSLRRAQNAREQGVYENTFGHSAVQGWVDMLKKDPSEIENLPANLRTVVGQTFTGQTNGAPLPTKLGATDKTTLQSARVTQAAIADLQQMVKDPEIQQILGPVAGRVANGESTAGLGNTAKQQEFITKLEYLFGSEGKTIFGGRAPQQLMQALHSVSANATKGLPEITGALSAANSFAQNRERQILGSQFGGKLPDVYKTGDSAAVTIPKGARTGSLADGTRVFSTDGGTTLYNASTGQKIQ